MLDATAMPLILLVLMSIYLYLLRKISELHNHDMPTIITSMMTPSLCVSVRFTIFDYKPPVLVGRLYATNFFLFFFFSFFVLLLLLLLLLLCHFFFFFVFCCSAVHYYYFRIARVYDARTSATDFKRNKYSLACTHYIQSNSRIQCAHPKIRQAKIEFCE